MENYNFKLRIDDTNYETGVTRCYNRRKKYAPKVPGRIVAIIPGTITSLAVQVGSSVSAGDTVLTLEAMKMNNKIKAPINGVVKTVNVTVGQSVAKGDILLEIR